VGPSHRARTGKGVGHLTQVLTSFPRVDSGREPDAATTPEQVPDIPLFQDNTAAFVHDLPAMRSRTPPATAITSASRCSPRINVLDRDKQLGVVKEPTEIVGAAAGDPSLTDRTWVLITESPDGGWGIAGHANTNADIAATARAALDAG
jgi:phenylpyruvate tautomerase PptA (4-oxalocrotonate tautomerase family)